jgi:uncharacterized protein (DUF1800 family)
MTPEPFEQTLPSPLVPSSAPEPAQPQLDDAALSPPEKTARLAWLAASAASVLAACGGGGGDASTPVAAPAPGPVGSTPPAPSPSPAPPPPAPAPSTPPPPPAPAPSAPPTERDALRFITQASFGMNNIAQLPALQAQGFAGWIEAQFLMPAMSHTAYIESQRGRDQKAGEEPRVSEEMSYEAVWQHWLKGEDQLRGRVVWALLQIMVISNIAPDIRAVAMSSYLDMLGKHAFGNFRQLLEGVALHPAMGYYLNMLESEKEDPARGTHPNENFAREVLQLFSIGLVKLNVDGTQLLNGQGQSTPTFDEDVVKGFAKAFSGWSYGGLDNSKADTFHNHNDNDETYWVVPMKAWSSFHSPGIKQLLDGRVLPAGQSAEKDMADALDNIFNHANVGPFIGRQLIQRLVTSNPSADYIRRVAQAFNDNGKGVRGDMRTVIRAVLLDAEARGDNLAAPMRMAKQREPVLRFATFLRALGAKSPNGRNDIHYLDSSDDALGQSPLLAPSVFNFYSPNYRPAGPAAAAGLVAPEFQITSETTVVGSLNFFAEFINSSGYGGGDSRLSLNLEPLLALAGDTNALVDRLDLLFYTRQMSASTRERLRGLVNATPAADKTRRVKSALLLTALSPDFVIQR